MEADVLDRLRVALATGGELDLSGDSPRDAVEGLGWGDDRAVSAEMVRSVLLERHAPSDPRGLSLAGARITGSLDLSGAELTVPLRFEDCYFDEAPQMASIKCRDLMFPGSVAPGLNLALARIRGLLRLDSGFRSLATVVVSGAHIDDGLVLSGAELQDPDGSALEMIGTEVGGDALLGNGFACHGRIAATGLVVAGVTYFEDAELSSPDGDALILDRSSLRQMVILSGAHSSGRIKIDGATIGGQLVCRGTEITDCSDAAGLALQGTQVGDSVYLDEGFTCESGVNAGHVRIEGTLAVKGLAGDLNLQSSTIQDAFIDLRSCTVLDLMHASIGTLEAHREPVIALAGLELPIGDDLPPEVVRVGFVRAATQTAFRTGAWPYAELRAIGWRLQDVHGEIATERTLAASWLDTYSEGYAPQPWHELASVYERNGHPHDARWLRWQAARRTTKAMPLPSRPIRWLYGAFVGYGYYPLLAVLWLLLAVLLAGALLAIVQGCAPEIGETLGLANPWLVAVQVVVPSAVGLGQDSWKEAPPWLAWPLIALGTFGWIQTALLLAGVTGLLRKS